MSTLTLDMMKAAMANLPPRTVGPVPVYVVARAEDIDYVMLVVTPDNKVDCKATTHIAPATMLMQMDNGTYWIVNLAT